MELIGSEEISNTEVSTNQTKDKIMKKFAISLIALAAISTAALASGNSDSQLRESDTYAGKYAVQATNTNSNVNALAVVQDGNAVDVSERKSEESSRN